MTGIIDAQQVSKRFGKRHVLDNVSLSVPSGTVFALLGENGAGKSTLIRGLLGYHKLDADRLEVCGLNPQRDPLLIQEPSAAPPAAGSALCAIASIHGRVCG